MAYVNDPRVAQPCDTDLTTDIDNLTITAVVVFDNQIVVGLAGGLAFLTGEPVEIEDGQITVRLDDDKPEFITEFVQRLEGWRDTAVPLRLCAAPGRHAMLIEDRNSFLPLPKGSFNSDHDTA